MVANGDSVSTTYSDFVTNNARAGPNDAYELILLTQEYTIPTYTSKGFLSVTVQANAFGAGGVDLTVKQLGVLRNTL